MRLSVERGQSMTIITATGEWDMANVDEFRLTLNEAVNDGIHLVIDLTGVEFLDSTALGVLVGLRNRLIEADGQLTLLCPHERILKLFRITGLDQVFTIVATIDQVPHAK